MLLFQYWLYIVALFRASSVIMGYFKPVAFQIGLFPRAKEQGTAAHL